MLFCQCNIARNPEVVDIFRLIIKSGEGNFHASSIRGFIISLKSRGIMGGHRL